MTFAANPVHLISAQARSYIDAGHPLWIGGTPCPAASGETRPLTDPSDGRIFAEVAEAGAEDVDRAVAAARAALTGPWGRMRPARRAEAMLRLANLLEEHARPLSEIESLNSGRLLANTRIFDVAFSAGVLRYMAGWATRIEGRTTDISASYLPEEMEFFSFSSREPVGVVAGITPWNVPLCQAVWKIAPALASGCTVVLKPAEATPLTALYLGRLAQQAGLPDGVVNIVTGGGETGATLAAHPDVDKVSFTGSTATGRRIATACSTRFARYTLELGGKSPLVLMQDATLEEAIPAAAWAIFGNHGQNCCAGSRLLVHRAIQDQVLDGVAKIARSIRLGPGLDPSSEMGPLISRAQQARVQRYIDDARHDGAEVLAGGAALEGPGAYVQPTVLAGTRPDMACVRDEIFGPVLSTMAFDDLDEAIALANDSDYGLGASIWTQNLSQAHRFIRRAQAGNVWVNIYNVLDPALPFSGRKASGVGQELAEGSILAHTRVKSAVIRL